MSDTQERRRAVITAWAVAALLLPGSLIAGAATAGSGSSGTALEPTLTQTFTSITFPTDTTIIDPTTTLPTTIDPTTTFPTTDPTDPTTTWPTTTTTVPPPPCTDPGPQPPGEQPSTDEPGVPPGGGSEVNEWIMDVADRILTLVDDNNYPGFAGVVGDPDLALLRLYWVAGEGLPPEIADIVANPGRPISVVREDATYSRSFLNPIGESLLNNLSLSNEICGFLHTIEVLEEGSGLNAVVEPYDANYDPVHAQAVLTGAAGVPVNVRTGPQPVEFGRVNDTAPWFGGGRIISPPRPGFCSVAFGVVDALSREFMLSAEHCWGLGAAIRNGNNTVAMGPVVAAIPRFDSEIIRVTQAGTRTFFGGVNGVGAAEFTLPVRNPARNVRGIMACASGSSTGQNCSLLVTATGVQYRTTRAGGRLGPLHTNMVAASSTILRRNGQPAVASGQGDSGGPIVTDRLEPRALGTVSAGTNAVHCGLFAAPGKVCGATVFYADINILLRAYGVVLK